MKRKIKPVPVILLSIFLILFGLYQTGILPSFKEIKKSFEADAIIIDNYYTWTVANNPVIIDKPLHIEFDGVLTINPGVEIFMADSTYILVNGSIEILGTEENPVQIKPYQEGQKPWLGIYLSAGCIQESKDNISPDVPIFRHVQIDGAEYGIQSQGCTFDLVNSMISSCETGIILNSNSSSRIDNNLFLNCGEAIRAEQNKAMDNLEMIQITGNEFLDCDHITINTSALFKGNNIHDFNTVYSALLVAPEDSHRVHIIQNRFENLDRALEIETIRNTEVLVTQNCFKDNGTNLYLNCNSLDQAAIQIRENNFLNYKTFNVKALSGCTKLQEDRIPLLQNWWGSSDPKMIEASIWQYGPASSVKVSQSKYYPSACDKLDGSGDASLVQIVEENVKSKPKEEERESTILNDLKRIQDSIDQAKVLNETPKNEGGILVVNGDTIKLPGNGENIAPLLDSLLNLEKKDKPEAVNSKESSIIEVPKEAIVQNFAFDDPGPNNQVYVCKRGVYTAFKKEGQIIYADEGSKVFLNSSGNHTVYLAKNAEIKVGAYSTNNTVYFHQKTIWEGEVDKEHIRLKVSRPDLQILIDKSRKAEACIFDRN